MSQISPPLRILLAGCILFLAAWFVLLKPAPVEPEAGAPATAAQGAQAMTGPGKAVEAAEGAAGAAAGATAQSAGEATGAAPGTAVAPATGSKAQPAEKAPAAVAAEKAELIKAGVPADVATALDSKVVALAFVNRAAADDRRVAGAMKRVYRHGGKVFVHTASIADVSRYAPITRGADVQQSPSVLVVDRHRAVTPLVGYVDSVSINQAVVDALLVDGAPVDDSPYLQKLEGFCDDGNDRVKALKDPKSFKQFQAWIASVGRITDRLHARIEGLKPPKQYRGLHRQIRAYIAADERAMGKLRTWVRNGQFPAAAVDSMVRDLRKRGRELELRLAGLGMDDCR